jgi:hypothetical protein
MLFTPYILGVPYGTSDTSAIWAPATGELSSCDATSESEAKYEGENLIPSVNYKLDSGDVLPPLTDLSCPAAVVSGLAHSEEGAAI